MKIALLGTAPFSRMLAPFNDPGWEIWACSPGNMDLPRFDVFFEIHGIDTELREPQYRDFVKWCKELTVPLYMQEQRPEYPSSVKYPYEEMRERFGRYFWTSSLSYMLALAITKEPEAIGLFGVDMSASEEYGHQRAGCHYFIQEAEKARIDMVVPFESDIMEPHPPYGFREASPMWWRQNTKWKELNQRRLEADAEITKLQALINAKKDEAAVLAGAMSLAQYHCNTYY